MTSYTHNSINQLTDIGGSEGVKQVVVRGQTNEPATVKVKSSIASVWTDARLLDGNRFESDQDLAVGPNQLNIRAKDGSGNASNYTYSLALAAATAATPNYDADGNLLTDGIRTYDWDMLSRLVKITWGAGSNKTTEYRYNALSQRSEQIEKTGTTETAHYYYLYEGSKLLCRYNGGTTAANIDRQYLSQGEQRKSGSLWASYYYNRDHLGSIREVMNSNGTLAARYDYEPYGKRIVQYEASDYTCDLGFTGHITQPSAVSGQGEIVLTLFRAYDPDSGKWLSADPIGEAGGLNLYGYGPNDPLNGYDELGDVWTWAQVKQQAAAATAMATGVLKKIADGVKGVGRVERCKPAMPPPDRAAQAARMAKSGAERAASRQRGIRSLEKRIEEHRQKLDEFVQNPTVRPGMEGQPLEVIEAAQASRIQHLQNEIRAFEKGVTDLLNKCD